MWCLVSNHQLGIPIRIGEVEHKTNHAFLRYTHPGLMRFLQCSSRLPSQGTPCHHGSLQDDDERDAVRGQGYWGGTMKLQVPGNE